MSRWNGSLSSPPRNLIFRVFSRAFPLAAIFALLAVSSSGVALGLIPDRALTQYLHRIWQVPQGLPQGTIYSIAQTRDGYLWLGTQTGLVRFDGVHFAPFASISGAAPENVWVRSLLEDGDGNLWAGTIGAGLFRLHNGVSQQFLMKDGLPSDNIRCLASSRNGDLWVCTENGLARFSEGKWLTFRTAQGLSTNNLRAASEARDGSIWFGGDSANLSVWNGSAFRQYPLSSMSQYATVRALLCSGDGSVWVGTSDGLIRLKNGVESRFTIASGLADNYIYCLREDRDGTLWIGTKNGFSRLRNGEIESYRSKDGLSQSTVYSLMEDREGSLWAGTKNGLNQFLDGRAIPYTVSEGLPTNSTGPVLQDRHGTIWAGTLGSGLARFDGRRFSVLTVKQGLASNTVYALAEDRNGDLWAGTSAGASRLRNGIVAETYTTARGLPGNTVQSLFRDRSGVLWIGTSAGLAIFQNGRITTPPGLSRAGPFSVIALGEDGGGRMFVASASGDLSVYQNGKMEAFPGAATSPRNVDAFYTDRDGYLWMGTLGGGLRLLKDGRTIRYFLRDGLFDNEIYGITADREDRLWMVCSKGVFSIKRGDLLKFADGQIHTFASKPYSPLDGLRTIEGRGGVQPAAWTMQDGRLWFSTVRGLLALDASRLKHSLSPPPVAIEDVLVNGQSELPANIEKLPPDRKNLEFHYTGLSFVLPSRITFRYILEGFDRKWIDAGARREAFYTNLPPGHYRFRVIACNVDGTCNETGTSAAFTLAPRYYQRAWFIPLCCALAGFIFWIAYQLRIRRLRQQFGLVLAERSRIARELHDTLIQGFSGVTMEMQALSARLSNPGERSFLGDIIRDAANCLREARLSVAGLRSARNHDSSGAEQGLAGAIAQAARQLTEAGTVRLRLKLQPDGPPLSPDIEYNLLRIAQEAVSNSVKHSGARTIEVALGSTAELVRLSIKDDGLGFVGDGQPGHYGLIGMKERASQIGGRFDVASEPGKGTTVRVVVPAPKPANGFPKRAMAVEERQ